MGARLPITIGPGQAVAHRAWREARDRALSAALVRRPSLVLVVGPAGTGKTLLLQELARALRAAGADAILHPRGDLPLVLPRPGAASSGPDQHRVVLIDEADRINHAALERLGQVGRCMLVLAGVADPGDPGPGRPASCLTLVRLAALAPAEVGAFVAARLAQAGLPEDLFSDGALARLALHSGGIPRLLNTVMGSALFLAGTAAHASRVEAVHIDEAAALRGGVAQIAETEPGTASIPDGSPRHAADDEPAGPAMPSGPPPQATPVAALPAPVPRRPVRRYRYGVAACAAFGIAASCAWLLVRSPDREAAAVAAVEAHGPVGTTAGPFRVEQELAAAGNSERPHVEPAVQALPAAPAPTAVAEADQRGPEPAGVITAPLPEASPLSVGPVPPTGTADATGGVPAAAAFGGPAAAPPVADPTTARATAAVGQPRSPEPAVAPGAVQQARGLAPSGSVARGTTARQAQAATGTVTVRSTDQLPEPAREYRCRSILVRSQLAEEPSYADLSFLRSGACSSGQAAAR